MRENELILMGSLPTGWWIMILELGKLKRFPFVPAACNLDLIFMKQHEYDA